MAILKIYEKNGTLHEIKIDDEDVERVKGYNWIWRNGYACRKQGKGYYSLHRFVMNVLYKEPILVDHINGDHNDNRKANLRRADRFQNQQNRKTNEGNTLPKGIRLLPSGKYNVRVQAYNQRRVFGAFDTLEEAVEARNAKAKELHGEFARDAYIIPEAANV